MQGQSGKRKGIFYSCMSSKSSWEQTFGRQAQERDRYNMGGTAGGASWSGPEI